MSKDLGSRWNFVEIPPSIPSRSGEDSTFDHFRSTPFRFIVREFIQNSMDAPADVNEQTPVKVVISLGKLNTVDYPELIGSLEQRMRACKEICDKNENSRNPYANKVQYLENLRGQNIPYLLIADYNTTGMEFSASGQSNFNAGVRQMGASHKGTGRAGGSHGLGKTVGFVASELNAVYYSTKTKDSSYGEGVIRLCNHKIDEKQYFADAFYDSHDGYSPDVNEEIPVEFRRDEIGTSAYVLGIEAEDADIMTMKQEVLRSFWMAIYHNMLTVEIEGEEFNQGNLIDKMKTILPEDMNKDYDIPKYYSLVEKFNPQPYFFRCILDESRIKFEADSETYPHLEHAILYICQDEAIKNHTDDRIVCMRDKEMVIQFYRPGTRKGYYGVLICDGEGSKYLRKMENVTHDKWDRKEVKELDEETRENSKYVLNEIDAFIKASIASIFPESDDEEYKVPVLNKYLVAAGNRTNPGGATSEGAADTNTNPQSPVSTQADGFTTRRVVAKRMGRAVVRRKGGAKKKPAKNQPQDGMGTAVQPTPPVPAPPTPPVPPLPGPEPPIPPTPNPVPPTPPMPPTPENPETGEMGHGSGSHKPTNRGNHVVDVQAEFRVVPIMDDYGLVHRIIINSDDDYSSCSMVITVTGEDRDTTLSFQPLNPAYRVVGKDCNILSDFNLVKGKNFIDIKFEDNDYHSLNIKAYEN